MYISVHPRLFQSILLQTRDLYHLKYNKTKISCMANVITAECIFSFHKLKKSKQVLTITYEKPFPNSTFTKK